MVPSGGFSPQSDNGNSNFALSNSSYSNYELSSSSFADCNNYGNLADTFDLSLLGDSYDGDMATVPSPMASLEVSWQQTSFYAPSPTSENRAFSPNCFKPFSNDQMPPAGANNQPESMISNNGISTLSPTNDVGSNERNALLRQYLADTTFQAKHNFKPLDLPTITVNGDDLDAIMVHSF